MSFGSVTPTIQPFRPPARTVEQHGAWPYRHVLTIPIKKDSQPTEQPGKQAQFSVDFIETTEEATVEKFSRVVEEVVLTKRITQHTKRVTDTARRTKVTLEPISASGMTHPSQTDE